MCVCVCVCESDVELSLAGTESPYRIETVAPAQHMDGSISKVSALSYNNMASPCASASSV